MRGIILILFLVSSCCSTFPNAPWCNSDDINNNTTPIVNTKKHETNAKTIIDSAKGSDEATKQIEKDVQETRKTLPEKELLDIEPYLSDIEGQAEVIRQLNEKIKIQANNYSLLAIQMKGFIKNMNDKDRKIVKLESKLKDQAKKYLMYGYTIAGVLALLVVALGYFTKNIKMVATGIAVALTASGLAYWYDHIALIMGGFFFLLVLYVFYIVWEKHQEQKELKEKRLEVGDKDLALEEVVNLVELLKKKLPDKERLSIFKSQRASDLTSNKSKEIISEMKQRVRKNKNGK